MKTNVNCTQFSLKTSHQKQSISQDTFNDHIRQTTINVDI